MEGHTLAEAVIKTLMVFIFFLVELRLKGGGVRLS